MLKTLLTISVALCVILIAWVIHPALGVITAMFSYGAVDNYLSS